MAISKTHLGALIGGAFLAVGACSAGKNDAGGTMGQLGQAGYGSVAQPPPGSGVGNSGNLGVAGDPSGGGPIFGTAGGSGGPAPRETLDGGCPAFKQKPETITVYKDAAVTDTITTYKPVALFIMQDRSSSMVNAIGGSSAQSWANSTAAVTAFVNNPQTAGIDIGLGVFPPMIQNPPFGGGGACDGSDCGQPIVPIAPLPGNGPAMINGYNQASPNAAGAPPLLLTPTECALRGMINQCLQYMANSPTGEQCVAVLVTDGTPTSCDQTLQDLENIVSDGHSKGVTTFTLGLPGSDLNALNGLAAAGGTKAAIDVTGGAQSFISALNNIRQAVSVTTVTHTSTPMVISSPLPCKWGIPPAPQGTTFDPAKVNVQFVPPGAKPVSFGYVNSLADCARATGDAWYYDNPQNPTTVLACPNTCNGTLHNAPGAEVDVLFGCDTIKAGIH